MKTISTLPLFVLLAILAVGCGRTDQVSNTEPQQEDLSGIYRMYRMHTKRHDQQPPEKLSDLMEDRGLHAKAFQLVREGKYIVVWGVKDRDPEVVLGYEKDAPVNGGWALMADGKTKRLDASAFQNLPKPQK